MKGFFCPIRVVAVAVALAVASPQGIRNLLSTSRLEERAQTVCGAEDSVKVQLYEISNNVRGKLSGGNSQCITAADLTNQQLNWSTSWTWSGSTSLLKSSPRAYYKGGRAASLWELHSIPASWQWSYTGSNVTANVVYDITGSESNSNSGISCQLAKDWSVQVWLGKLGAIAPLSSTGHPINTTTIRGVAFDVYKAEVSGIKTYTFVAASTQPTFSGDLLQFVQWLVDSDGLTRSVCVQSISAGTDIFAGAGATFDTTSSRLEQYITPVFEPIRTTTTTQQPSSTPTATCAAKWAQCGGSGYMGFTCCQPGTVCNRLNAWYSQCQ